MSGGGRFDFDDGGTYCGGWEDGKAHGFGVCTGPKGQGEYCGAWQGGFELSGVYTWPSGNTFEGQWMQGKRHGLGIESKGRWVYRGEWTQGFKGRYGVRQSTSSGAKYEGTWTTGLQDGYGVETYADGGTYQGQWLRGVRHGYGVRQSVQYGLAAHYRPKTNRASLTSLRSEQEEDNVVKDRDRKIDEGRGGFVLQARSDEEPTRRRSIFDKQGRSSLKKMVSNLKLRKQKSTGDIQESPRRLTGGSVRSTVSTYSHTSADSAQSAVTSASQYTDSNQSFVSQDDITEINVTETYMGEWKNDKRSGFGVSERSDGLKYEGEWYNNKKYGYGVTIFKDGSTEEGKYKNNVLISSGKKSKIFLIRSSKLRERVDNAVSQAQRAAQIALQKADIAISRMANARAKSEQADQMAVKARNDSDLARIKAKEYAPEFHQPGSSTNVAERLLSSIDSQPTEAHITESTYNKVNHPPYQGPGQGPGATATMNHIPDKWARGSLDQLTKTDPRNDPRVKASPYVDNTDSRMGMPNGRMDPRFSVLLHSSIEDHFDQYGRYGGQDHHPLAGIPEPDPDRSERRDNFNTHGADAQFRTNPNVDHRTTTLPNIDSRTTTNMDPSPDSGISEPDTDSYKSRPLERRKTLPSIMTMKRSQPAQQANKAGGAKTKTPTPKPVVETPAKSTDDMDTYIIDNGIRKRVRAEVYSKPPPTTTATSTEKPKDLTQKFKIEQPSRLKKGANRGSLPDVSACKELESTIMPREEASKLSSARRQELIQLRDEEERRRQREVVLRLSDVKDWCQERQLMMFVVALNIGLATMFFNLLN